MGCTSSKTSENFGGSPTGLSDKDILARIEAPKDVQTISIGGYTYSYAYVSQRGYYPESLNKDNQDAFSIQKLENDMAFFAVYDGHGKDGHLCARFARDNVNF